MFQKFLFAMWNNKPLKISILTEPYSRLEVLKLLLEKGANSKAADCLGNNALHLAVKISNNTDTIKYLVEHVKLDVNSKNVENETALHLVSYYGYMSTVDYLVENGAQVDARDKNNDMPLHIAASYGNQALIKLLLNIGNNYHYNSKIDEQIFHSFAIHIWIILEF